MRKIISADYIKKYDYKGYTILKLKNIGKYNYFYAIYYHKVLKLCTSTLKKAQLNIDQWIGDTDD